MAFVLAGGLILGGAVAAGTVAVGATTTAIVVHKRNQRRKKFKKMRTKLFIEPIGSLEQKYLTDKGIPVVIELTCRQLELTGCDTEGLFRVPGNVTRIQFLADAFRKGTIKSLEKINLSLEDVHDVGGVFKLYLRSIPEALCTFELYEEFLQFQTQHHQSDEDWLNGVAALLNKLPEINRLVFNRILPFFNKVCQNSDVNKMTTSNMSIVFGPTLFAAEGNDQMKMLSDSRFLCDLLTRMINDADKIIARTSSMGFSKLKDKTVNASVLFKKQQMVDMMAVMEDETDEELLEELKEIEELLVDDLQIVTKEELEAHPEEFESLPELPQEPEPEPEPQMAFKPPPAAYRSVPNKPLPGPPQPKPLAPPKPLGAPPKPLLETPASTSTSTILRPPVPHKPPPRPPRNPPNVQS